MHDTRPLIGLTPDLKGMDLRLTPAYGLAVVQAGGIPVVLPPLAAEAMALVQRCDGIILTGGDDPIMEHWGEETHASAQRVEDDRQVFELAILSAATTLLKPTLGICLGMQYMGLVAGGKLDQHLPDGWPTAALHAGGNVHHIEGVLGAGHVHSRHHQALQTSGQLEVLAQAEDGLIEAIGDPEMPFWVGVQWHPERSGEGPLGSGVFDSLIDVARSKMHVAS